MTALDHSSPEPLELCLDGLCGVPPVSRIAIDALVIADSPRLEGQSRAHVKLLAEVGADLPPILVHRPTMKVIDGIHRVLAARLRDDNEIEVQFFDGSADDAFVLAVSANVSHGRPLTLADRKAAAANILTTHAAWSDRRVGHVTGLSHRTVASIRSCSAGQDVHLNDPRLGLDGKLHPLTNWAGRQAAAELIRSDQTASLRDVAKKAGVSPGTVRDVRARLGRGQEPVPTRRRRQPAPIAASDRLVVDPGPTIASLPSRSREKSARDVGTEPLTVALDKLRADPAIRFNERGRALVRVLAVAVGSLSEIEQLAALTPSHCRNTVASIATTLAQSWLALSDVVVANSDA